MFIIFIMFFLGTFYRVYSPLTLFPGREIGMSTALAVGTVRRSVSEYAV